jgi:hypothetical protein
LAQPPQSDCIGRLHAGCRKTQSEVRMVVWSYQLLYVEGRKARTPRKTTAKRAWASSISTIPSRLRVFCSTLLRTLLYIYICSKFNYLIKLNLSLLWDEV